MSVTERAIGARLDRLPIWPYRRIVLVLVGVAYFFAYFEGVNLGVALPGALEAFDASLTVGATIVSITFWGAIVGSLLSGYVCDRWGRRNGIITAVLLVGVGSVLTAISTGVVMFTAMRFVAVVGGAAATTALATYMSEIAPAGRRGRSMAWSVIPAMLGFASVPFIGLALVPAFDNGWRMVLMVPAIGTLVFLVGYRWLPESPRWLAARGRAAEADRIVADAEAHVRATVPGQLPPVDPPQAAMLDAGADGGRWRELVRAPHLRWTALFSLIWFGIQIPIKTVMGMGVTLLTEAGFDITTSISLTIGMSVGVVGGALVALAVTDRWPRKYPVMAIAAACGSMLVVMGFHPTNLLIVLAFGGIGAFIGMSAPLLHLLTAEHFPTRIRSRGCGLVSTIGDLGGIAGPWVALGAAAVGGFSGTWIVMGALFLSLCVPLTMTRNTTRASLEETAAERIDDPADLQPRPT